ncbi:hypothetical protein Bca52824_075181 [Brassica carinata]|uniref:Uncharacterized protein n=1 Tax=Brassica carinata TaxID=52824 RepID=A0A8X7TVG5_BRACI|nr:hypothetical protein Bca52824_075181 [Brassica carinata]
MLPGWDPDLAFGDGSGTSEVPIPDFDDFFAGLPSGFDAPPYTNESGRPKVVAEGSRIINGDRTWTVVKERHREDSSHGKMCGDWVIIDNPKGTKKSKTRKGKEAAGASGQIGVDGTNPTKVLPTQEGLVNNETGEPLVPILPTEVQDRTWTVVKERHREDSSHGKDVW